MKKLSKRNQVIARFQTNPEFVALAGRGLPMFVRQLPDSFPVYYSVRAKTVLEDFSANGGGILSSSFDEMNQTIDWFEGKI